MKSTATHTKTKLDLPRTRAALWKLCALRPIRDKATLEDATRAVDLLAGHPLNEEQEDYLDVLSLLVEEYERENHPASSRRIRGRKALAWLLKENDLNATDLARILGLHRSMGSKLLKGERELTLTHLEKIKRRFRVSPALFV